MNWLQVGTEDESRELRNPRSSRSPGWWEEIFKTGVCHSTVCCCLFTPSYIVCIRRNLTSLAAVVEIAAPCYVHM